MGDRLSLWGLYQKQNQIDQQLSTHTHDYSQLTGFHTCASTGKADYATTAGTAINATNASNADTVNNKRVLVNVPADAKFTDTTYSLATTTSNGLMSFNDKAKLDGISSSGSIKVESSTINGNIKINEIETKVYVHPTGTNPHSTTKTDVGLSNVDNTSDLNKPISTIVQTALNGKSNTSHTHDDLYYTESEINTKLAMTTFTATPGTGITFVDARLYKTLRTVHCFIQLTIDSSITLSENKSIFLFTLPTDISGGALSQEINLVAHSSDNNILSVQGGFLGDMFLKIASLVPTERSFSIQGEWTL